MLSPSLEDYLEELYRFSLSKEVVRVTDLSQKLGVSLPAVTKALRKLKVGKYILYQPYGIINLTDLGRELGGFLVERNRLLQEFLGLICVESDIASEVEGMEHYFSNETIVAIKRLVQFMKENPEYYQNFLKDVEKERMARKNV